MRILLLFVFTVLSFLCFSQCPWNLTDCRGRCGRYFDNNSDGYCDLGLVSIKEIIKKDTIKLVVDTLKINNSVELIKNTHKEEFKYDKSKQDKHKSTKPIYNKNKDITPNLKNKIDTIDKFTKQNKYKVSVPVQANLVAPRYSFISITLITLISYLISSLLVKFEFVRKLYHRRFWNAVLLITFLVSALLGLFLVVQINYSLNILYLRQILILHVEFGIAMAIISIIHIIWHIKYFKNIFKQSKHN